MSYDRDNIPEKPTNLPLAGENPNATGHLDKIPYDKDPLELHYGDDEKQRVDTGQLAQVQTGEYWSPRPPAQELPVPTTVETIPVKKKNNMKLVLGGVALGVVTTIASAAVYINAITSGITNSADKNLPPVPDTNSTAPVVPGQAEPKATETGTANNANAPLPTDEWKFNNADGSSRTQADIISESKVSPDVYETITDQYNTIFSRIESAINYFPDEQTVRANLNIPAEQQLDREHYFAVVKEYQDTVFDTIISGDGELRAKFDRLGRDTAFYRGLTIGSGDKELYEVKIVPDVVAKQKVAILDNGGLNSIGANAAPEIGEFRYYSPTMSDLTVPQVPLDVDPAEYEPTWQISSNVQLIVLK